MEETAVNIEEQIGRWGIAVLKVYRHLPFDRTLLQCIPVVPDTELPFVASVKREAEAYFGFRILYNPALLVEVDDASIILVLLHELSHIHLKYFARRGRLIEWCKSTDRLFSNYLCNVAGDIAANELLLEYFSGTPILGVPDARDTWFAKTSCHTRHMPEDNPYGKYEPLQSTEYYFKKLCDATGCTPGSRSGAEEAIKKRLEDLGETYKDGPLGPYVSAGDQDEGGAEDGAGEPLMSELQESLWSDKVREALGKEEASGKKAGTKSWRDILGELYPVRIPKYNWKVLLNRALKRGKFSETRLTIKRPLKRWTSIPTTQIPLKYPARSKVPDLCVKMIRDTSGSMSREDLIGCTETVLSLKTQKPKMLVTLIDWDCRLQGEYEIRTVKDIPNVAPGRGGTDFSEAILYARDTGFRPDVIVYMTDGFGYAGESHVVKGINFIWMLTNTGGSPCEWGTHIRIK